MEIPEQKGTLTLLLALLITSAGDLTFPKKEYLSILTPSHCKQVKMWIVISSVRPPYRWEPAFSSQSCCLEWAGCPVLLLPSAASPDRGWKNPLAYKRLSEGSPACDHVVYTWYLAQLAKNMAEVWCTSSFHSCNWARKPVRWRRLR